jgi:hypothetical protein
MTIIMRIERLLPYPPKEVWAKLIKDAEATDRGAVLQLGTITRYQSPSLLECRSGEKLMRWELLPRGEMTLLVYTEQQQTGASARCCRNAAAVT